MADPANTARVSPSGISLKDGYSSKVAFSLDPDCNLWEVEVTPPGVDGGEAIDTTTMHNTSRTTFEPQSLLTTTPSTFTAAYDPNFYTQLTSLINQKGSVTVEFPDGSDLDFYGYLQKFEPQGLSRGGFPLATVTIQPTDFDPTNKVEAAPVMTEVAGT